MGIEALLKCEVTQNVQVFAASRGIPEKIQSFLFGHCHAPF